jgi:hypothetical protein
MPLEAAQARTALRSTAELAFRFVGASGFCAMRTGEGHVPVSFSSKGRAYVSCGNQGKAPCEYRKPSPYGTASES